MRVRATVKVCHLETKKKNNREDNRERQEKEKNRTKYWKTSERDQKKDSAYCFSWYSQKPISNMDILKQPFVFLMSFTNLGTGFKCYTVVMFSQLNSINRQLHTKKVKKITSFEEILNRCLIYTWQEINLL